MGAFENYSYLSSEVNEIYTKYDFKYFLDNKDRICNRTTELISNIEHQYEITTNRLKKLQK